MVVVWGLSGLSGRSLSIIALDMASPKSDKRWLTLCSGLDFTRAGPLLPTFLLLFAAPVLGAGTVTLIELQGYLDSVTSEMSWAVARWR